MTGADDWAAYLDPDDVGGPLSETEAEGLDRIADAVADDALWSDPPASLRDRILAEAMFESADLVDPEIDSSSGRDDGRDGDHDVRVVEVGGVDRQAPTPAQAKAQSRWFGRAVTGAVAAAIAVIATIGVTQILADDEGDITTFAAAGTPLAPDAAAQVDVEPLGAGVAITLNITGLPPAGEGEYYAGWLTGDDGQVPIGSFHWREGGIPIELWSGVDTERYPRLGITLQREGEPTTSNGELVLTADLSGAPISD